MTLRVAILMKDPAEAKTRLAGTLEFDARERLALTLFENTLTFLVRTYGADRVGVVTPSQRIAELAQTAGAAVIDDDRSGGINGAAALAARWAKQSGASTLMIVHADIPVLDESEFRQTEEASNAHDVVIAGSADGGTNAILVTPPDAISYCFGRDSAAAHEKAARAMGRSSVVLKLPHLSRDIDRPADLATHPELAEVAVGAGASDFHAFAVAGLPEVVEGDDPSQLIADALDRQGETLKAGDIVVVAQKIVSKAEGRLKTLSAYVPSSKAGEIAAKTGKDARKVEAILQESDEILRTRDEAHGGLIITRHKQGWVCANAGIDESNIVGGDGENILLLPEDPDASAQRIRAALEQRFGVSPGVIISDTFGRPWRNGLVNIAIGVAGVPALIDWAGRPDAYGRVLAVTMPAFADELAAAAGLLMAKDAGIPVVVMRGLKWFEKPEASARDVLRPVSQELFL